MTAASRIAAVGILTGALLCPSLALAAAEPGSRQTREYLQASAQSDQFEILEAIAVLAESKNAGLRAFAERMIEDHRRSASALRAAALRAGLTPPEMSMSADQAMMLGALQGVTGAAFDKLYAQQQSLAHRSALAVESLYATSGENADVRGFAGTILPLIERHLAMVDALAAKSSAP
ncbi:MAG: DUF4142 domain-containing protein [Sphingomonas sp.]|uniref:DUF4142 domain-containing protein n=1 Tax=Sphingomonas sp. TaxID=28214 RepID=UPI001AC94902|nr:DUF4142 domain-containing protein [Sphingomonas sp.]MBN8808277.1 DUF4142 domain-containing protein [Sphingomonas sp.]